MNENTNTITQHIEPALVNQYITQDLRNSVLIISLFINLALLTAWIAIRVTTIFDAQVVSALFGR